LIFFDFRPIHGNSMIAEALRAFLGQRLKSQNIFFAHMAGVILKNRPPVNFLKGSGWKRMANTGTRSISKSALSVRSLTQRVFLHSNWAYMPHPRLTACAN